MKHFFVLFLAAFALLSCESTETNSPALQGEIDEIFFRANDARAIPSQEDESFDIIGITEFETLTLHIRKAELGVYPVGEGTPNYATFEDRNGNIYTSEVGGSGEIVLSDRCLSCGTLSGSFNFEAILPGIDTVNVDKGIFFEVRFPVAATDDPATNAGTFVARINDVPFSPFNVAAANTGNNIIITGSSTSTTLTLRMPFDVTAGSYPLPGTPGFGASYAAGGDQETAVSGNIIVIEHDTAAKKIKGTFSFETASASVTVGQFNVSY